MWPADSGQDREGVKKKGELVGRKLDVPEPGRIDELEKLCSKRKLNSKRGKIRML